MLIVEHPGFDTKDHQSTTSFEGSPLPYITHSHAIQHNPATYPTLHIGGLPPNITPRELSHIFRPLEGFLVTLTLRHT